MFAGVNLACRLKEDREAAERSGKNMIEYDQRQSAQLDKAISKAIEFGRKGSQLGGLLGFGGKLIGFGIGVLVAHVIEPGLLFDTEDDSRAK